eukprot:2711638-Rhodomonas_salina.2
MSSVLCLVSKGSRVWCLVSRVECLVSIVYYLGSRVVYCPRVPGGPLQRGAQPPPAPEALLRAPAVTRVRRRQKNRRGKLELTGAALEDHGPRRRVFLPHHPPRQHLPRRRSVSVESRGVRTGDERRRIAVGGLGSGVLEMGVWEVRDSEGSEWSLGRGLCSRHHLPRIAPAGAEGPGSRA